MPQDLLAARERVSDFARQVARGERDVAAPAAVGTVAASGTLGRALFDAVFTDRVAELFAASQAVAQLEHKGVRLRMRTPDAAMAAIPWELLRSADDNVVCLSDATPLVRALPVPRPLPSLRVRLPLRILAVLSNLSARPLDLEREQHDIQEMLGKLEREKLVRIEWLLDPEPLALENAVSGNDWHVLHFAGHGGFDSTAQEGHVVMVGRDGKQRYLSAKDLGLLLQTCSTLRLVFLNACDSARGSSERVASSTAAVLSESGVPAIIAMQFEISDRAAATFAQLVYRGVARMLPVDEAVTAARRAMYIDGSLEWATPVLYLSGTDGTLLRKRRSRTWLYIAAATAATTAIGGALVAMNHMSSGTASAPTLSGGAVAPVDATTSTIPGPGESFGDKVDAFIRSDVDLDVLIDGVITFRVSHASGFDYATGSAIVKPSTVLTFRSPGFSISRGARRLVDGASHSLRVTIGTDTNANIPITREQRRAAMGSPGDVPALVDIVVRSGDYHARSWAIVRLGAIGDPRAIPVLIGVLDSTRNSQDLNDEWVQGNAALAIAEMGARDALPHLRSALQRLPNRDHYAWMFESAIGTLAHVHADAPVK